MALVDISGDGDTVVVNIGLHPDVARGPRLKALIAEVTLSAADKPCTVITSEFEEVSPQNLSIMLRAQCPLEQGVLEIMLPFLERQRQSYRAVFMSRVGGVEAVGDATPSNPVIRINGPGATPSFGRFVTMGIEHIGATPNQWFDGSRFHFPEGIDHILFVLALLVAGGSLLSAFKTVSGFTVGHSITLALATLGLVHVPSRIVESAISLSIAIVAIESIVMKGERSRWRLSMAFGLVHGLGFASALSGLHLGRSSLFQTVLGFNVGVELGQAVIVACAFPLLLLLNRHQPTRRYALATCSIALAAIGGFWFMQRAFGA
jgi:hypothetical protein